MRWGGWTGGVKRTGAINNFLMMSTLQKEELRRTCLAWLAARLSLAFNVSSIQRGVNREMPCTVEEVADAMVFLNGMGLTHEVPNKLGGTKYYQISAEGILAYERGD